MRERETKNGNYSCEYRQNSPTVGARIHLLCSESCCSQCDLCAILWFTFSQQIFTSWHFRHHQHGIF